MKRTLLALGIAAPIIIAGSIEAHARGFGAVRAGGFAGARGAAVRGGRGGVAVGPLGGMHAGAARSGAYVGPRGTTVQAGRVGRVTSSPLGGVRAGGARGARVTTPAGRTYTTGSAGRAGVGRLGGVRATGTRGAAVSGPFGGASAIRSRGVGVGPLGGVAVGGSRAVAVGHGTRYVSPAALHTQAGYVRGGYRHSCFTTGWYRTHPVAWNAGRWRVANYWLAPAWTSVAQWCGVAAPPVVYDYGSTVVIQNDNVYVGGEQVATADQYADQAAQYADRGRTVEPGATEEWQSLGVFGMIQGEEQTAQHIFQLAVDKSGVVRGNYYDALADNILPVYGSVDPKSQRVAWSIGEKKEVVFETGLNNLTQNETTVLVHYGKERTQQMMLVRIEQPAEGN